MNRYISLLRGINVSGQKKIKMADLKELYEKLGCANVATYIQSGNVVFDHPSENAQEIKALIEEAIENQYSFSVYVDVITPDELKSAQANIPFDGIDIDIEGNKAFIAFLSDHPEADNVKTLQDYVFAPDRLEIIGKILYLQLPNGAGKSKLSTNFIENKLKITTTMRNLKTTKKLCEMAAS